MNDVMFAFAISDTTISVFMAAAVATYLEWSRQRTARLVAGVKEDLADRDVKSDIKLEGIEKTGRAVHYLVNSSMLSQLRISALALRRIAILTKDPKDMEAALMAEELYKTHEVKQRAVDAMPGPPAK